MTNIYIGSSGGLGNKMKNLVSGMIMSDSIDGKLFVEWIVSSHCGCRYDEIFESPQINTMPPNTHNEKINFSIPRSQDWQLLINNEIININNISEYHKKIISTYFQKFIPIETIRYKIDTFINEYNLDQKYTIGIHYRYDNEWLTKKEIQDQIQSGKNFAQCFFDKISQYNATTQFFLAFSNNNIISNFSHVKNLVYNTKNSNTNENARNLNRNKIAMIEAVIDMYLLSLCNEIIITPNSTFSECAWYIGGCKAKLFDPILQKYIA